MKYTLCGRKYLEEVVTPHNTLKVGSVDVLQVKIVVILCAVNVELHQRASRMYSSAKKKTH